MPYLTEKTIKNSVRNLIDLENGFSLFKFLVENFEQPADFESLRILVKLGVAVNSQIGP